MKSLWVILAVAALLAGGFTAGAQTPAAAASGSASIDARVARADAAAKLSADQKTKVKSALQAQDQAMASMKAQNLTWQQRRTAAKAIQADTAKKLKESMSADQYTKYQADVQQTAAK